MISQILELYARCGRSLSNNGLDEAVLPLSEAEYALNLFAEKGWIILGGDVYQCNQSGEMDDFYADWFYSSTNCIESIAHAKSHLSKLVGDNLFVSFTIKNQ
ncbi:TPA: hypothetical protein PXP51_004344 [Yersinia enterocolitica]|uniref:hypothetical protein n=1 Tax=Yersinia enterocolitica TaxID=630 RepID=UPI001C8E49BA|nr:hypothetical protein [Yersinia enterocolitica]MBX9495256.1 hypothetical protein [Yersinia enterocolitica]HDL7751890.1 hypothetical protein [Yersinia enterocolitica]HDL7824545.1 hypothetical protein [Yersinia enterocolitica]HDL7833117.1 hypothetical protein [Yersinia enterocolitica]HDL7873324.1 hypothetical protein [Yersinia enterocolitica]